MLFFAGREPPAHGRHPRFYSEWKRAGQAFELYVAASSSVAYPCEEHPSSRVSFMDTELKPTTLSMLATLVAIAVGLGGGCDNRYADAVVYIGDGESSGGIDVYSGAGGADPYDDDDGDGWDDRGIYTLCHPCDSHRDCGAYGDLCLYIRGDARCGMACESDRDCPRGYECVHIDEDFEDIEQCVPQQASCSELVDSPSLEDMQAYILEVINELRTSRGLEPLELDLECLSMIGQEAVLELETEGTFKTKFTRECADQVPNCACGWQEESQAFVNLFQRTWREAVVYPFERAGRTDPEGGFFRNVVSAEWRRIGIGALVDEDYLRFSLEFAP